MIYNLLQQSVATPHLSNLFHYITLRSGLAAITSFLLCLVITPKLVAFIRNNPAYTQPIRDVGPKSHQAKVGTPTMGGAIMLIAIIISILLFADLYNPYIWIALFVTVSFGLLGFVDDYTKLAKRHHAGISGKTKLLWQFIVSIIACYFVQLNSALPYQDLLSFPFFKSFILQLGYFYFPFCAFVIVGASNAVNLTDGLDGLASVPIAIAAACLGIISYVAGHVIYAHYLQIFYIPKAGELAIFAASIFGAALGFLWYNSHPASIFMGDTGSLALGGALGIISVITKHEIVLGIIGGVFVLETLSVIIQVYYFKLTKGKRFFRMAPLHHHFEQLGWPESKVVIRFWIMAVIFGLLGLATLKLR